MNTEISPTLAEDARVGLPALRLVNLRGWGPLAFSGCGWQAGKDRSIKPIEDSVAIEVVMMNAEFARIVAEEFLVR